MKAFIYFVLFYASIFLISLIPAENTEEETSNEDLATYAKSFSNGTSYVEFSDSIRQLGANMR